MEESSLQDNIDFYPFLLFSLEGIPRIKSIQDFFKKISRFLKISEIISLTILFADVQIKHKISVIILLLITTA